MTINTRLLATLLSRVLMRVFDAHLYCFWTAFKLLSIKPDIVYVTSNPPILLSFCISLLGKVFNFKYVYHVQDIHPEISNLVFKIPDFINRVLKKSILLL